MKNYTRVGKGSFSSVYRKGTMNKVLIVSNDPVKECMSMGWFPDSKLFPKVKYISSVDDDKRMYSMKYYEKVIAPKKQLNKKSYKLYLALRGLYFCGENNNQCYQLWYDSFNTLTSEFNTAKIALLGALDGLANYGSDMDFEISPRNIATTKSGRLILLDCFFMRSML